MTGIIYVICVIYVIFDIFDMYGALTYTIGIDVYMGVKRSVRISGMQLIILDFQKYCVCGQKMKYPVVGYFLCIFQNFLCIFFYFRGSTSLPPRNLKFSMVLIIPHRNGISLSANTYLTFAFFV